jgi:BTB/POZ domain
MSWAKKTLLNYGKKYQNHHKLIVYRHYIVYFINNSTHIEDVAPDIRKSMIADNFDEDVVFVVDDLKFSAHKKILKMSNEQFYIQHVEAYENSKEIEIKNVDPRGFQQFLRFCHYGDVNLNMLNMMQSYDVALTFNHSKLLEICTKFICDNIESFNVLEILNWNLLHQSYQIMNLCREFFIENTMTVLKNSEQFRKIDKKLLKKILSWQVLNCSEKLLFNKTLEWAEQKCIENHVEATMKNKKQILEDILYLIRLEISANLEAINDFPASPRGNRFTKKRFDNLYIQNEIVQTREDVFSTDENVVCFGFSIVLSNPELKPDLHEKFLMTIESENDLIWKKSFNIRTVNYLAIKDFVFEVPVVFKKHMRHILKVKFIDSHRLRYMEKDELTDEARILRLYNFQTSLDE